MAFNRYPDELAKAQTPAKDSNYFLGHPLSWWIEIHGALERYGIRDADQLKEFLFAIRFNRPLPRAPDDWSGY